MKNEKPIFIYRMAHPLALIIYIICQCLSIYLYKDSTLLQICEDGIRGKILLIILSTSTPFAALYVLKLGFLLARSDYEKGKISEEIKFTSNKKSKK